jgi:hypothetical protein
MTDKGGLRVEIHDKVGAIDKLARALGMYTSLMSPPSASRLPQLAWP